MTKTMMGFSMPKLQFDKRDLLHPTKLETNTLRQLQNYTSWSQPQKIQSQKKRRGSVGRMNALPDWPLMAVMIEQVAGQRDYIVHKSVWHLSDAAMKNVYTMYIMFTCWGCCFFGATKDPFYDGEEYRKDGGDGTVHWYYEKQEDMEAAAREELWREELIEEIEQKVGGLRELEEAGTEEELVLKSTRSLHGRWDQILELALLRPDIGTHPQPSPAILGEALFFALRVLLSRSLSRSTAIIRNSNCVFVLLVDSQYGGVVKLEGDINKLDFDVNNVYECASEWFKVHAKISVSPIDQIWNKLGNCNWGDIGTLRVLLATYHSIIQFFGLPKDSLEDLATEHGSRLQSRRTERHLVDSHVNENSLFRFQQCSISPEIVEVQEEESVKIEPRETLKLEKGSVIWLEDSNWQKGFVINEVSTDGELPMYSANPLEEPGKSFLLYVGSSPSHLEPAWEDMNQWYQVQRQTKVLTLMKQRGLSSKYLPQIAASGRIIHPGSCNKPSSGGNCNHPWCGTPILVTSPVGVTVSTLIANGLFGPEETLRCCHDCLSALVSASSAGIRHGDIRAENVIRVSNSSKRPFFVLIGWGHAVLEDRDRPSMNLFFSSTYALQEGKLCAASDAESLIYLLYFACGGVFPELDSVEGALQWREVSWSKRVIQQKLGDISAVLKAFADYVDSLCGTPYPIDYEIWLRRLRRTINEEDHGKEIVISN